MLELAAIAGTDPERYTLRELETMAKAADQAAWCRTFAVLAQLFNAHRDGKKSEAIDPMKFYPWSGSGGGDGDRPAPPTESQRMELRELFPGKK